MNLTIRSKPPRQECAPKTAREVVELVQRSLGVEENADGAETAIVTIGPDRPAENSNRIRRVHFRQDGNGALAAIDYYALGKWRVFHQAVIGEMRYFRAGQAPEGWAPANGENGLEDVRTSSPEVYSPLANDSVLLHVYGGVTV